ncbi:MAG: mechanosensitive ion channel domain-containing protein [Leeuwenhoekiella sp.]
MLKKLQLLIVLLMFLGTTQSFYGQDSTNTDNPYLDGYPDSEATENEQEAHGPNPLQEYNKSYYIVNRINENIGLPPKQYNFRTPQATLEHFIFSSRNSDFEAAAYALNYNLMPLDFNMDQAKEMAEKLYFVLNQRVAVEWSSISDRPDGQVDIQTTTNQAIAGAPRRSIVFGEVFLKDRDVILRLQRIKYEDYGAFWLISADAVENIDALYQAYGPLKLDRWMPSWARLQFLGLPIWKFLGTLLLAVLSFLVGKLSVYIFKFLFKKTKWAWFGVMREKLTIPIGVAIGVLFFYITLNELISFGGEYSSLVYSFLLVIVICAIAWLIMRFIDSLMLYVAQHRIGDASPEDNDSARQMLTYISVARRVATFLIIIVAIVVILGQFRYLEKLGISLLASAGVMTVVLGIAAQSTLGNIIAGLQIALTRPAKIGDTVIIQDDWGYVEDIRFTYMVVRTWDMRRLVIPLRWVINNIFENWSMTSAQQVRGILLHADYRINVQAVREKFEELLKASEDWDEELPPKVQVTEVTDDSIVIRALCSGKDASTTWDLHCKLREELVAFIAQLEDGMHLTKSRVHIQNDKVDRKDNMREG